MFFFSSGSGLGPKIWKCVSGHIVIAVNLPVFGTASEIICNLAWVEWNFIIRIILIQISAPCDVGHLLTSSIPNSSILYSTGELILAIWKISKIKLVCCLCTLPAHSPTVYMIMCTWLSCSFLCCQCRCALCLSIMVCLGWHHCNLALITLPPFWQRFSMISLFL